MKNVRLSNDFLEEKIHSWLITYHDTSTDRLTKSILRAVLVVSDNLLHQRALLLPRWRLKRGTEQVAERRNEGTEQLQIVEEPVMNGTRV